MPIYSKISQSRLSECHEDLQVLMNEVIKNFDCVITCGYRGKAEQDEAFKKGNSKLQYPKSKHNQLPSLAVDAIPYPVDYKDTKQLYYFAGYVKGVADRLLAEGKMKHKVRMGADFNRNYKVSDETFNDVPHIELIIE